MNIPDSTAKLNNIRAAIFDLDGTMVDSVPDIHLALNLMKADFSLEEISRDTVRRLVGRGTEKLVRDTISMDMDTERTEEVLPAALTSFYRHYRMTNGCLSTVYTGVTEGLRRMRESGLKLACVTNKPAVFTEPLLAKKGLYLFLISFTVPIHFPVKNPIRFRCGWPACGSASRPFRPSSLGTRSMTPRQPGRQAARFLSYLMVIITVCPLRKLMRTALFLTFWQRQT